MWRFTVFTLVCAVVSLLLASVVTLAVGVVVEETVLAQSEYERVRRDRDGAVAAELHAKPFQVWRGGGWVPIDTSLVVRADGVLTPRAAVGGVEFSPGGRGVLARLAGMSLTWPGPVPRPVVVGDSATYPDVLAGVDVVLIARSAGFSLVVVVKSAAARVAVIRLGATRVRAGPGGSVTAGVVSGAPVRVRDGRGQAVGAVRAVGPGGLTVRPDQRGLAAPWTRYPVRVTQEFSAARLSWMTVGQSVSGRGEVSSWQPPGAATAGVSDDYDMRALFEVSVVPVQGRRVRGAVLRIPACVAVEAWHVGEFDPATTWTGTEYREWVGVTDCGRVDVTSLLARAAAQGRQRVAVAFAARRQQGVAPVGDPLVEVRYD